MKPPDLQKGTTAAVELVPQFAASGGMVALVLIKQRFRLNHRCRVTRDPDAKVLIADEPWDKEEPAKSSIRYPSDVCLHKPSTDVLVVGEAVAKHRASSKELEVSVRVGPVLQKLRVLGPRVWVHGVLGLSPSEPVAFESVPLRWELAYGGPGESRNPVGRGFVKEPKELEGTLAPQLEEPGSPVKAPRKGVPAGVGAIGRHWAPRKEFAGTADERWMRERMPLPPLDFDDRFNQAAAPGLVAPGHLRGGEPVQLLNMSERGPMEFDLPRMFFGVSARRDTSATEHRAVLDTVLLEPSVRRFELTWRAVVPIPRKAGLLRAIRVVEKVLQ